MMSSEEFESLESRFAGNNGGAAFSFMEHEAILTRRRDDATRILKPESDCESIFPFCLSLRRRVVA
jgi:hypothetical protein